MKFSVPLLMALSVVTFAPVTAYGADSLDGIWRSQGYGYVFNFQGSALKAFEVTRTTCVAGFTATRSATTGPDREVRFTTTDKDVLLVRPGGDAANHTLHFDGSASDMHIDRLPRLPPICEHPMPDTPLDNFEVFTRTWAENYISFDLKHVDWDSIVSLNRSKVAPGMAAAQLFDLFEAMIKPVGDAHTFINAPKLKRRFRGIRPGTDRVVNELAGKDRWQARTDSINSKRAECANYLRSRIQDTFTALSENFVTNRLNMVTSVPIPATSESYPSTVIRSRVILQLA